MTEILQPKLVRWIYDDDVEKDPTEWNWNEITMFFNDGSTRWSILCTPERLKDSLCRENIDPPGLYIKRMIIVRRYSENDIQRGLEEFEVDNVPRDCHNAKSRAKKARDFSIMV